MLPLLEKDYKEIETMTETIKGQKKTIEDRERTIEDLDRTIEDKNAALLRLARELLQQGVPASEVAAMSQLSLEEIGALSVQGSRA